MNWLRDKIRAWLGIARQDAIIERVERKAERLSGRMLELRTELDALEGEIRARQPEPQQVSLRINVDDYEASQIKALEEFREEKGKS